MSSAAAAPEVEAHVRLQVARALAEDGESELTDREARLVDTVTRAAVQAVGDTRARRLCHGPVPVRASAEPPQEGA